MKHTKLISRLLILLASITLILSLSACDDMVACTVYNNTGRTLYTFEVTSGNYSAYVKDYFENNYYTKNGGLRAGKSVTIYPTCYGNTFDLSVQDSNFTVYEFYNMPANIAETDTTITFYFRGRQLYMDVTYDYSGRTDTYIPDFIW